MLATLFPYTTTLFSHTTLKLVQRTNRREQDAQTQLPQNQVIITILFQI